MKICTSTFSFRVCLLAVFVCASLIGKAGITIDSVKTTPSTCADNGTITIYATTTSSSLLYSIISGPSLHPLQSSAVFASLAPGTYGLLITDFGNDTVKVSATVSGSYTAPSFSPTYTNPVCPGASTGVVVGNPTTHTGTPPFTWELTNTATNVTITQSSDTFRSVAAGIYTLREYDSCGNFSTIGVTLTAPNDNINLYEVVNNVVPCDSVLVNVILNSVTTNIYNAQPYIYTFQTPVGTFYDTTYNSDEVSKAIGGISYGAYINITITNACGVTLSIPNTVADFNINNSFTATTATCTVDYYANFYVTAATGQTNVNLTNMADPVTIVVRNISTGALLDSTVTIDTPYYSSLYSFTDPLPSNQTYKVTITDGCGRTYTENVPWPSTPAPFTGTSVIHGNCYDSTASIELDWYNIFTSDVTFELLSGPSVISSTKPYYAFHDSILYPQSFACYGTFNDALIQLENLAVGTYHYKVFDTCGASITDSFVVTPQDINPYNFTAGYIKGCPGNSIITASYGNNPNAYLSYGGTTTPLSNPSSTILNLNPGVYVLTLDYNQAGAYSVLVNKKKNCNTVLDTITIPPYSSPQVSYATQVLCNGSVNVIFQPDSNTGVPPYKYEILSGPQTFGLQYSNTFLFTKPGSYVARVSDSCGFANTFSFTVDTSSIIQIVKLGASCLGGSCTLSCPYSPYATYVWKLPGGTTYTGDSLVINPILTADYGTYNISEIVSVNGCRDTFKTAYVFSSNTITQISDSICPGTSMVFGGISRSVAGIYYDTVPKVPCDSITELTLTIKGSKTDSVSQTICFGQSIIVGTNTYTATGIYRDTFVAGGCDSIVILNLTVKPWSTHTQTLSICFGQSVTVGAKVHSTSATYIDTLINAGVNGCDSVVTTNLTVKPWATYTQTLSICFGQSVTVGAKIHNTSATYIDTLINAGVNGCDSVVTTNLTVKPWATHTQTLSICFGQSVTVGAKIHNTSATYIDTLINAGVNGCDSVVTTILTVKPWATHTQTLSICSGQSVTVGTVVHSTTGTFIDTLLNAGVNGCDSVVTTNLTVKPWANHTQTLSICAGQSVTVGAKVHTTSATYIDTLINASANGCDSIVTTNLTVKPWARDTQTLNICAGQSVTVGTVTHSTTGNFIDTLLNAGANGCDSIVTTNLNVLSLGSSTQTLSICFGTSITVGTVVHNTTGTFIDTLGSAGCDSIVTTHLTVKPWATYTQTLSICFGQSVTVGAKVHNSSATYIDTLINAGVNGCDSVVTTNLTVKPWAAHTQTLSICFGQSVTVGAIVHSTTGTFIDTLLNAGVNGCDSVVTTNLTVKPWAIHTQTLSICFGQSVTVGAVVHSTTGTFIDTLLNAGVNGCDSVVTTNLTIKPWTNSTQTLSICHGQSITVGAVVHSTTGTFIDTLLSAGVNGCDSVVTTNLTVKPWTNSTQTLSICFGQSVTVGTVVHSTTGTFIDTLLNAGVNGCDSVVTTNLTVKPWATHTQTVSICFGQSVTVGAIVHSTTGTFIDTLLNAGVNGCDSVVTTNLTVKPWGTNTQTFTICFGQSVTVGTTVYTSTGTFTDTLLNAGVNGCDSVVTTNIIVKPWATYTQTLSICFGQSVTVGAVVHNTTGTFIDTLLNAGVNGCDSVVTTNLTIKPWTNSTQTLSICFGQSVIVGAIVHSTTGTFIDTLLNAGVNGCDSVVTTNLTVKPWTNSTQTLTICNGQSIIIGSVVHSTSGTFIDTVLNAGVNGCDSVVTTNLTVKPLAAFAQTLSICFGDSVIVGTVTHHTSGTFIDTLLNAGANGCDSVVTTNLTVMPWGTFSQTLSTCYGQTITVGATVYNTTGTYIDTLVNAGVNGCDSIVTTNIIIKPWASYTQTLSICFGDSVIVGAVTHNTTGTFIDTLINAGVNGCDSVVTTDLTVKPWANSTQTLSICFGQSITVGSFVHNTTGTFIDTLLNAGANGCDSVVTTHLTVMPWATYSQAFTICFGQSVTVGTVVLTTTGTFIDTLLNAGVNGCDSVITTHLTVMPWATYSQTLSICFGDSVIVGSVVHNATGTFIDTLLNAGVNGCDSVVTTNLTVKPWATYTQTLNICFGQSITVGTVIHNTTGTFIDTLINAGVNGCDSVVTTTLTILPWANSAQTLSICFGQSITVGAFVHNTTGTFIDTLLNAGVNGCDSVVTTTLTVMPWATYSQAFTICFGDSVIVGSVTHNTSGTFIDTLTNAGVNGCDSVVTTDLTILPWAAYSQAFTLCLGQSVTVGTVVHSATGTFIDTLSNAGANGCDSVVTTNLTVITPAPQTLDTNSICISFYNSQTYTSDASVIDTIPSQQGCDSIYLTVHIHIIIPTDSVISKSACIYTGQSYTVAGVAHTTPGTYADTVRTVYGGCDSVITNTALQVITPQYIYQHLDSCYTATIDGVTYSTDTIARDTTLSRCGLDSIIATDTLHFYDPSISIVSSAALPIVAGEPTQLTIIPSGSYQNIIWSPDYEINNLFALSPTVSPRQDTTYYVTLENEQHCIVKAQILIPVVGTNQPDFLMPTAFSPNGDGLNDLYRPVIKLGPVEILSFQIYDRWGQKVYDSEITGVVGWDGTYRNVGQPIGVYIYYVTAKVSNGSIVRQTGNVTLIR